MSRSPEEMLALYEKQCRVKARKQKEVEEFTTWMAHHLKRSKEMKQNPPPKVTPKTITGPIHPAHEVFLQWQRKKSDEDWVLSQMKLVVSDEERTDEELQEDVQELLRFDGDTVSPEFIEKCKRHAEKHALEEFGRKLSL
ncbi:expressed unknown protein [Seminavis robusta]|uniref:Uncharacterized protein n=1 Tax=Seminavis robusta TaxID=568900 RepID=A0A9N8HRB6_9STRA|nr:expressed unknown protein [Seminavis robusta]|eukprot:Sro1378_g267580.1 n/a (140) ;mRNA; f:298-717